MFARYGILLGFSALTANGALSSLHAAEPADVAALIRQAGNTEDEGERLAALKRLRAVPGLDAELKADVDRMVAFVERWNHDKSLWSWYQREIRDTCDYDFGLSDGSPLAPLAAFYRGRMIAWVVNEYGGIIFHHDSRRRFLGKAVEQFRIARAAFPNNRLIGMYLGEPIPVQKQYPSVPGAPEWAALQREYLERLSDIVEWWIDHRMQQNGEYGGGWDDDCEMWRDWVPVMIAFKHPKITAAQARFSEALLSQPYIQGGYTRHLYDVEHTSEPTTDTITPMMHLAPDDPAWRRRAMRLAELMETVWTGRNERGLLQFKSTFFNVERVDTDPKRACDTPYHTTAVGPVLVLWQRTGDKRIGRLLCDWLDTWVDAAARAERGKPAGILPAAIHWPDGAPCNVDEPWWDPKNYAEHQLYRWPSSVDKLADALLLAWHMTGEDKYLRPIRSMAAIRLAWLKAQPRPAGEPGSEPWCAGQLGLLAPTLAKYRALTGSREFDEILRHDYPAGLARESGDRSALVSALRRTAEALRINFQGYTSEVRFTDRVFTFGRLFGPDMMFPEAVPASNKRPNTQLLYATATGDPGGLRFFPLNAVRWLTPPRDIAALVTRSGTDGLTAELFHFGEKSRPMGAELYLLDAGQYQYDIRNAASGEAFTRPTRFEVTGPRTRISFDLPPRRLVILNIQPAQ